MMARCPRQPYYGESGSFYGTLDFGGNAGCLGDAGCGAVFKLAPDAQRLCFTSSPENMEMAETRLRV